MTTITIQKGQTLGRLAKQHHTSVETLAKLNQLKDPNKIIAGKKLIVSQDTFTAAKPATKPQVAPQQQGQTDGPAVTPKTVANPGDGFDAGSTQQAQTPQQTQAAVFTKNGRTFPSSNGYPLYSQNKTAGEHEPWAKLPMGSSNVGAIGCAMTAVTMGISGISGQTITPDQSNKQVNKVGGFTAGGALEGKGWSSMGALTTPPVTVTRRPKNEIWTANRVDQELAAGRPVVMEVDYKTGPKGARKPGHDGQGDHWILVTGKTADGKYMANDPASGKQITLQRGANGKLETPQGMGGYSSYQTTGQVTTFDRGPAKRPATPTAPTQPKS
ncbi:LysM peptidoglycan-binding domain-containing protein, partial [Corallococcus exercitus]|uniref:LysM peptidoglycan-binding domain-containing protein n=1 Tax=Corallococcus exercitus TaxID=2316736 RepID=UPI000EA33833